VIGKGGVATAHAYGARGRISLKIVEMPTATVKHQEAEQMLAYDADATTPRDHSIDIHFELL
jgi:hypothetical protein